MKPLFHTIKSSRITRYLVAGGLAFVAESVSFLVLYYEWQASAVIGNTGSFLVGLAVSFSLQKLWVFSGRQAKRAEHQLALYLGVAGVNLLATNVFIYLLVTAGVPAFTAKVGLIITIAVTNFLLYRKIFKGVSP